VLFRPCAGRDRLVLIARWLTSGAVSVILVALFMTPCLLQIAEYTKSARSMEEAMDAAWMRDALSFIGTGLSWKRWDWGGNPLALSLKQSLQTSPFLTWATLIMLGTAIVAGTVRLVRSGLAGRVLAMILVLPAPLAFAHFSLKGNTLFHWYLVGSILSVAVLAAAGAAWVGALMAPARLRSHLPGIAFLLLGGGFAILTHGQRELYRTHPIEPLEESVRVTRNVINPLADGIDKVITIGFVMNTKGYDPAANEIRSVEALDGLIERARSEEVPLFVNFALPGLARLHFPKIMDRIENPDLFERVATLYGLEKQCTRLVYRLVK